MHARLAKLEPQVQPQPEPAPATVAVMPSATELYEMICEAAYFRAEKRGFAPGLEAEDWLQAEAEVLERVVAARR